MKAYHMSKSCEWLNEFDVIIESDEMDASQYIHIILYIYYNWGESHDGITPLVLYSQVEG